MLIRWHGHACFEFSNGSTTIVIDPHDGRSLGIKPPVASADVVLITHEHYDHNKPRVIKGEHVDFLGRNGTFDAKGITVTGFPSFHDYSEGSERGFNTIYKFIMDDVSICHVGDLGCIPPEDIIEQIKGVDFLFIPVGEVYTMDLSDIKTFIELVNPRIVVPMHYLVGGLSFRLGPLDNFLNIIPNDAVDFVGNEIDVTASEMSDTRECWVFDN